VDAIQATAALLSQNHHTLQKAIREKPKCTLYMRIAGAVRQRSGRRSSRRQQSPRVPTPFALSLTLYHFSITAPTYALFPAVRTDSRISHKSGSISPPETAAAPKSSPINSRTDIQLPQFPSSETTVPQRPRGSSPQQAEIKPPKYFTTAKQADEAAQKAMHQRIHLLPNQGKLQATIGKCSDKRQEFENGLMNPSGPALDHPAAPLLSDYAKYGCPVDCGPNWTREQIEEALDYGAHPTAKIPAALECLEK
jgi:hypothetical protein